MANLKPDAPRPPPSPSKGPRRINLNLLKDCIEQLGLALATHHHHWTPEQRRLWERSWVEIRRHASDFPEDYPIPTHRLPHQGIIQKPYIGAPGPVGVRVPAARSATVRKVI